MTFAGYNAQQKAAIFSDWNLLDTNDLVLKMAQDPALKELFQDGPANPIASMLKRPPSPRVLRNIIRHFIKYEKDRERRPLSTVKMYYNFSAEVDKTNTYRGAAVAFEAWRTDAGPVPLTLDESSFKVLGDNLFITPKPSPAGEVSWGTARKIEEEFA